MVSTVSDGLLRSGPAPHSLLLAHGAGAAMDSEFMNRICELLAERGVGAARFEFPYMQQRRQSGSRRPPDRQEVLLQAWREVIAQVGDAQALVIGGKSMGGRMASMLADEVGARGLVCLGYPFHPPRKPERLRIDHLRSLHTPTLIFQGTRDALGCREEVPGYPLADAVELHWLEDGDHDLKPRKRSGLTQQAHLAVVADRIVERFFC